MKALLLLSLLMNQIVFAQTNAEVKALLSKDTSTLVCGDKDKSIPGNAGFNAEKKEAYIYFPEGVDESSAINKVLIQAKEAGLSAQTVEGVASLIPWGSCLNKLGTHSNFEELKKCNEPLAKKRAENVQVAAKKMFNDIEQIKSSSVTSKVGYNDTCKIYDKENEEAYYKYQYVYIKFGPAKCVDDSKIFTSAAALAMSNGKCSGICQDNKSTKLPDGTVCTRYLNLLKPVTIKFDAMTIPDRFTIIQTKGCKADVSSKKIIDYSSGALPYFKDPNPEKFGVKLKKTYDSADATVSVPSKAYQCSAFPAATEKNGYACENHGDITTCVQIPGYAESERKLDLKSNNCNSKLHNISLIYKVELNKPIQIDYKNKKYSEISIKSVSFKSIKAQSSKIIMHHNLSGGSVLSSEMNEKHSYISKFVGRAIDKTIAESNYDKLKVTIPLNGGGSQAHEIARIDQTMEKIESGGIKINSLIHGPVPHSFEPGRYCIQVEAPLDGTYWSAK